MKRLTNEQRQIVENYLPLVKNTANRIYSKFPTWEKADIISELSMDLMQVVSNHDPKINVTLVFRFRLKVGYTIIDMLKRDRPKGYRQKHNDPIPITFHWSNKQVDSRVYYRDNQEC